MKFVVDTVNNKITGPHETVTAVAGDAQTIEVDTFFANISDKAAFDTGLMPLNGSGLLSYKKALGYEQFVYQREPGLNLVKWGNRENDSNAIIYQLAFPYVVIIADFKDNNFVGLRHFYSPDPIQDWDQPLYAVNVPNTNTVTYRGVSVGWVCLYQTIDTKGYTIDEKIRYFVERQSGLSEPYNNNNMRETDGTRFYQARKPSDAYMWEPDIWQAKSKAEGFDWICDPDNLIMLKCDDNPNKHYETFDDNGTPYTIGKASKAAYSAYYYDEMYVKPFNDPSVMSANTMPGLIASFMSTSVNNVIAKAKEQPPMELLSKPNFNWHFTTDVKNFLLDSIKCGLCEVVYKDNLDKFSTIVISYEEDEDNDNAIEVLCSSQWCPTCTGEAIQLSTSASSGYLYDPASLIYCINSHRFSTPSATFSCNVCDADFEYLSDLEHTNCFVYTNQFQSLGCINCNEEDKIVRCEATNFWILKESARTETVLALIPSITGTSPVIGEKEIYIAPWVQNFIVCACQQLVDNVSEIVDPETNKNLCVGCVGQKLFAPMIVTPVTISE